MLLLIEYCVSSITINRILGFNVTINRSYLIEIRGAVRSCSE